MMLLKPNSQFMRYPISALWRNEMCMYIVVSVDRNYDLFPNPFRFHLLLYLPHLLYTLWITEVYCSFIHLASSKCSGCLSSWTDWEREGEKRDRRCMRERGSHSHFERLQSNDHFFGLFFHQRNFRRWISMQKPAFSAKWPLSQSSPFFSFSRGREGRQPEQSPGKSWNFSDPQEER